MQQYGLPMRLIYINASKLSQRKIYSCISSGIKSHKRHTICKCHQWSRFQHDNRLHIVLPFGTRSKVRVITFSHFQIQLENVVELHVSILRLTTEDLVVNRITSYKRDAIWTHNEWRGENGKKEMYTMRRKKRQTQNYDAQNGNNRRIVCVCNWQLI